MRWFKPPGVNWKNYSSNDNEEKALQLFDDQLFQQAASLPTLGKNVLDATFVHNREI